MNAPTYNDTGLDNDVLLNITVYDDDTALNETPYINVSFYGSDTYVGTFSVVGENNSNFVNDSEVTYLWTGIENHTTVEWYANLTDGWLWNKSATWIFTTYNNPPNAPVVVNPVDGEENASIDPYLIVNVTDPDVNDLFTVRFYNAIDDSLIGVNYTAGNGENTSILWPLRLYSSNYTWYVNVTDDGRYPIDALTIQSDTWSFVTRNYSCGEHVNRNVTLVENLTCSEDAVIINASSITIDGDGFHLTGDKGSGDYGIVMEDGEGWDNIDITDINIHNFNNAIRFDCTGACSNVDVTDSYLNGSNGDCIYFNGVSGTDILNVTERNTHGDYWGLNSEGSLSNIDFKFNDFTSAAELRATTINASYNEINISHTSSSNEYVLKANTFDAPTPGVIAFNNLTGPAWSYSGGYQSQGVIDIDDGDNLEIYNNTIRIVGKAGVASYGIQPRYTSPLNIHDNYITNQTPIERARGIYVDDPHMIIHNNTIDRVSMALYITDTNLSAKDNEILNCSDYAFYFFQSYGDDFVGDNNFISNEGGSKLSYGIYGQHQSYNDGPKHFSNNKFINLDTAIHNYRGYGWNFSDNNFTDVDVDLEIISQTEGWLGDDYIHDSYWMDFNDNNSFDGKYATTIKDTSSVVIDGWDNVSFFMIQDATDITIKNMNFNNNTKWVWTIDNCSDVIINNMTFLAPEGFSADRHQQYMIFTITDNVTFANSTITGEDKEDGTAILFYDNSSNYHFDNITINGFDGGIVNDGWWGSGYPGADPLAFSDNLTVENCFINTSLVGLHFEDLYNSKIRYNEVYSATGIGVLGASDNYHYSIANTTYNVSIYNNTIGQSSTNGIYVRKMYLMDIYNNTLTRSNIGFGQGTTNYTTVEDNIIDIQNYGSNTGIAMSFSSSYASHVIVRRNEIYNAGDNGISLSSDTVNEWDSTNISIYENNIINSSDIGIYISATSNSSIYSNNITHANQGGIYFGGIETRNETQNKVYDNILEDTGGYAFYTYSYGPNVSFYNNTANDVTKGFYIAHYNGYTPLVHFAENVITEISGSAIDYDNGGNNAEEYRMVVENNNFSAADGNTAYAIQCADYNATFKENRFEGFNTSFWVENSNCKDNRVYNNYFYSRQGDYRITNDEFNELNTTKTLATNIIGGAYTGGNAWYLSEGTGFSENATACNCNSTEGICQNNYTLSSNNIDYLSLCGVNFAPTHSQPILNATTVYNLTEDNLTVYNQSTNDVDEDPVKNIINWYKNGTSFTELNYPFEGGSNATWTKDYSGHAVNATAYNTPTWNETGGYDGSGYYSFDAASSEYLNTSWKPSYAESNGAMPLSFSMWFRTTDTDATTENLFGHYNADDTAVHIYINEDDIKFKVSDEDSDAITITITAAEYNWADGNWHHALVTTDMEDSVYNKFYLDGVSRGTSSEQGTFGGTKTWRDYPMMIGARSEGAGGGDVSAYWPGDIDDFMAWETVLTEEQAIALYNNRTDLIVSQETSVGDVWKACITPNDGTQDGIELCSNNLTVRANAAPTHTQPILNSTTGNNYSSDNLTVYNQSTYDADDDAVKNIINWYKDDISITVLNMPFEANLTAESGTKIMDYSGFGNNGTVGGNAYWNATGGYDGKGAYEFDGNSGHVSIPDSALLEQKVFSRAYEVWVKMPEGISGGSGTDRFVISKYKTTAGEPRFKLGISKADGTAMFVVESSTDTDLTEIDGTTPLNDSQWHQIVVVRDRPTDKFYLYVDGESDATPVTDGDQDGSNDGDLYIGDYGRSLGDGRTFNGTIDEVRIYNRSLSAEQVAALYANRTDLIVSQETSVGDVWKACITPNDGNQDGLENCSNNLTILNYIPTQGIPILNATTTYNLTADNLTVYNQSTYDEDGESVKNIINWFKDDVSLTVLNMPFEGHSGNESTTALDYSGYDNDGVVTLSGNGEWNSTGGYDGKGAYHFGGNGAYINISDTPELDDLSEFTISVWLYHLNIASDDDILVKGRHGSGEPFILWADDASPDHYAFLITDEESHTTASTYTSYVPTLDHWTHLALSFKGGNETRIYINGVEDSNSPFDTSTIDNIKNTTDDWYIASDVDGGQYLNGYIDDLMIFNHSLSAEQILALNNSRTDLIVSQETSLGDTWKACITPNDGNEDGAENCSNNLTILNIIPVIEQLFVNSSSGRNSTSDDLTCWVNATDVGDTLDYSGYWYKNGVQNESITANNDYTQGTLVNVSTLSSSYTSAGDDWSCNITAYDGTNYSTYNMSDNLTINSAPVITQVKLNSSAGNNGTIEDLICWANGTDVDGGNLIYGGEWYKNGSLFVGEYWNATYTRTDISGEDRARDIAVDSDGDVYVTGYSFDAVSGSSIDDYHTIKYNATDGSEIWNVSSGVIGDDDWAYGIAVDSSENVYVTGYTDGGSDLNYLTIKYDPSGNYVWNATYDGGNDDEAYGVAVDSDGNVYVTGYTDAGSAGDDWYTIKYNSTGDEQWNADYGYPGGAYKDQAHGIAVDNSGNIYVTGESNSLFYIIKYNSTGDEQWNANSSGGSSAYSRDIALDSSGNVYVTGETNIGGVYYYHTIKYNSSGDEVWNATHGLGLIANYAEGVAVDSFGNVYVAGRGHDGTQYNYHTVKYNSTGDEIWNVTYDSGVGVSYDAARAIAVDDFGNIYVTGESPVGYAGHYAYYTIRYKDGFVLENQSEGVLVNVSTLESQFTSQEDNWSCSVRAYDGDLYSTTYNFSNNLTIVNAAPVIDQLFVNSSSGNNVSGDDLSCWANSTDAEGSNLTYYTEWYKNGSLSIREVSNNTYDSGYDDYPKGIAADSSGNYYVTGNLNINGDRNYYTIKYNSSGDEEWNATFDFGWDVASAIAVDDSGNVYVTGNSNLSGTPDYYTIKYNSTGDYQWNATFDGGGAYDYAQAIAVDSSGNVYVTGGAVLADSDYYTIKYNSSGDEEWNATYGVSGVDSAYGIAVDSSGNVYVTGRLNGDYYTIKYDSSGNHVLNITSDASSNVAYGIVLGSTGDIYITGGNSNNDYYTIKYNSTGDYIANATYDGGGSDYVNAIAIDSLDNIYVTGYSYLNGNNDYYTIKYNSSLDEQGSVIYDSSNSDEARAIAVNNLNEIYVTGDPDLGDNDYHTIKYEDIFTLSNQTQGILTNVSTLNSSFTSVGDNWSCGVQTYDGANYSTYNISNNLTILVILNNAPDLTTPNLVSLDGSNKTLTDLNCSATITDEDVGDTLNVTVEWYKDGSLDFSLNFNNDYSNGTVFSTTLDDANTTKGDVWKCGVRVYDGQDYSSWKNSTGLTILNTLPTVSLISPADGASVTDRTPLLEWDGSDDDGDSLTYEVNVSLVPSSLCTDSDRNPSGLSDENYTVSPYLNCLYDNGDYYIWNVRASDDEGTGSWSSTRSFNVTAEIIISLPNDAIEFGNMNNDDSKDTTTDNPAPFTIQNDGNCLINITINGTQLFDLASGASDYYKYKIDNVTGEEGSFNWGGSVTTWGQMPITTTELAIVELDWDDANDIAEADLYVLVPTSEGAGTKETTVYFTASLGE
jgi:uncharacterized delta-60 repeat protein